MAIPNTEREDNMGALVMLVDTRDLEPVLFHMPKAEDDPDDEQFRDYFEIVRDFYYIQANWRLIEDDSLKEWATEIVDRAEKYGLQLRKALMVFL
ncbi:MAG: hypothetical protein WC965_02015 [Thiohalomonadaceae bacterium]